MRTFIAIDLDPEIKKALADFLSRLKKNGPKNISWVQEKGMHLTLKFLGEIEDAQAAPIVELLGRISGKYERFPMVIRGTGYFPPNPRYLRVIWVGAEDQPVLLTVQREIESELEKLGFPREKRAFHPHLTLGRVRAPVGLNPVLEELQKNKDTLFGEMRVRKITFFRSQLRPTGAEYTVLAEADLA